MKPLNLIILAAFMVGVLCMASIAQTTENLITLASNCSVIKSAENVSVSSTIGPGNSQVTFILTWQNATSILDMGLSAPGGKKIDSTTQPPDIYRKNATEVYYIISDPVPGNWTANIRAKATPGLGEDYCVLTLLTLGDKLVYDNESGNVTAGVPEGCPSCNQSG